MHEGRTGNEVENFVWNDKQRTCGQGLRQEPFRNQVRRLDRVFGREIVLLEIGRVSCEIIRKLKQILRNIGREYPLADFCPSVVKQNCGQVGWFVVECEDRL